MLALEGLGPMHLADARGGEGLGVEAREERLEGRAELRVEHQQSHH
jgi:hypothetical protein